MSSIIIQEAGKPDRIFRISQKETIIGRGADADIALPHITVSREHAKIIHLTDDDVYIENINDQDNLLGYFQILSPKQIWFHVIILLCVF